ncbi:MAG: YdcF family protein [Gammaproteobacteria bacterium]|nr:YdcF family protein [Gammaproteobacteria bacterium]
MEIFLSKLIPLFIYPVGVVSCALLAAALLLVAGRLRLARVLVIGAALLLFGAGNGWTAFTLVQSLENDYPAKSLDAVPEVDVIIVLGGGLGLPHPPRPHTHLGSGADRLLYALQLHRAGKAPRILLTGGNVFPQPGLQSEAYYARELLGQWGVPESAIIMETESRNTIENAEHSARIIAERGWNEVLLVTSATHMHRAVLAFRHAGVAVTPAPTDFLAVQSNRPAVLSWIPNAGALSGTTHALHEYIGRLWYRLRL